MNPYMTFEKGRLDTSVNDKEFHVGTVWGAKELSGLSVLGLLP